MLFDVPPLQRQYVGEGELVFAHTHCGPRMPNGTRVSSRKCLLTQPR
jgi:hypothetical protein